MATTQTYTLRGMTCQGCARTVESTLHSIPGVRSASADPATGLTTVESDHPIPAGTLIDFLQGTRYTLAPDTPIPSPPASAPRPTLKDFTPLIAAAAAILLYTAAAIALRGSWNTLYAMRHFEGAFFLLFGSLKLLNWSGFAQAYATYDLIAARSRVFAYLYPLIELALGLAYLASWNLRFATWATLILMLIGSAGVLKALTARRRIACACLGAVFKLPMTWVTLVEDLLMAAMSAAMLTMMKP